MRVVIFKSNCIILRHYLNIDSKHIIKSLKRKQNNCIWNCLFNISIEANVVDPVQTAPTGSAWSRSTLFVYALNILVDDKNNKCESSVYTVWFS